MKKFLVATAGILAMATSASAADLSARPYTKAPMVVAAAYDWSGFYIGLNGGGGSSHKCWDLTNNGAPLIPAEAGGCHDATGGTVGGQLGYRWQASNWVFGLEAQGNWADFSGSNAATSLALAGFTNRSRIDAFGLFTGQVGYAWNNALLYVKGGAAVVNDKYSTYQTATALTLFTGSETRWGAVIGAGVEFGFAPNWSVGVEYDHMFMGSRDVDGYGAGNFGIPVGARAAINRIGQDVDMVTARLNYRWGGPVVAKY
ncbi:MAG: outer membrane beta-barrel protein [Bradyrhizobium sp.]|uniref:outer membrane protein n=1 Tax=Bradyrhizobium sp. TaxID=376 RepID=UPI002715D9E3|nr:outer membrane beta-barrel protein [Bradyrhizobium sp.]MDO8399671.1 outer membrane beta-barrel protein [Bradyrhizobium sp.]